MTTLDDFALRLGAERALAILRWGEQEVAARAMDAAVRGGFRIVEFTMGTAGALELVRDFARQPEIVVGVGTVLSAEDARAAVRAGARFLVSPVVDPEVIREGHALGVAVIPGGYTPTELLAAYRAGARLQKLFPAGGGGPEHVRALLGPMPFLRIVPTQGVGAANAAAYLAAGAHAVGFVGSLFVPEDLRARRYERIEERAGALLAEVRGS